MSCIRAISIDRFRQMARVLLAWADERFSDIATVVSDNVIHSTDIRIFFFLQEFPEKNETLGTLLLAFSNTRGVIAHRAFEGSC